MDEAVFYWRYNSEKLFISHVTLTWLLTKKKREEGFELPHTAEDFLYNHDLLSPAMIIHHISQALELKRRRKFNVSIAMANEGSEMTGRVTQHFKMLLYMSVASDC
jgi:hypothetical protein